MFFSILTQAQNNVINQELQQILNQKNDELIDINILLKQQMPAEHLTHLNAKSDSKEVRREIVINELKKFSEQQQESVMAVIEAEAKNGNVTDINAHWLVNSINCKASRDVVYQLASHPDVKVMGLNKEDVVTEGYDENDAASSRGTIASHVTHIQAEKVWDLGYTGKGVTVAVLDSGCNLDHVDIKDHLWTGNANGGYNFVNPGQRPMDNKGHGSHCAGIVCGDGTSGVSTGIAPDATLMVLKVNDTGGTKFDVMVDAIEYAVENKADIISISIGWWVADASRKETFRSLFENALEANVVVAASAGGNREYLATYPAPNNINSPADCPPPYLHKDQTLEGGVSAVISVGGVDEENNIIGVSSQGPVTWQNTTYGDYAYNPGMGLIRPDIVAQGASVKSLAHNSNTNHAIKGGTSMAAPAVAGVMALMLEKNPDLTPAELCRIIEETATPLSQTKSNDFGSGCINALAAVQAVSFDVQGAYLNKYNYTRYFNTGTNQNLELTLVNNGAAATAGTTNVTLTSNDSNVTVANGSATISNTIAVNGTATCNFTINVSNSSPVNHVAKLTVTTSGDSNNSFEIEINISNELVAPSNITTQVQNLRDINLSWEATNNATSYNVYRDGNYIANTASTSYSDAGLEYGTLYTYTITSKRNELESESSREIRVLTGDNPETPSPTNVTVDNNNTVSWTNSTGSKSSNVYRKESSSEEEPLASKIDGNSYTDNDWNSLPNGIYQYGVSNNHATKEEVDNEGFESSTLSEDESTDGWFIYYTGGNNWTTNWSVNTSSTLGGSNYTPYMGEKAAFISSSANKNSYLSYLVTPQFDYTEYDGSKITLNFHYITPSWKGDINTLNVKISTTSNKGEWTQLWSSNKTDVTGWPKVELDLSEYAGSTFYIAFENVIGAGYCTGLDEVSINVEGVDGNKESRIEWSGNIYKGINVFVQDGDMNNGENWVTNSIPNVNDNVIIDANAVVNGTVEVNSLTINEGKTLTLNEGAILTVNGNFNNTDPDAFIINDGAQVIQSNENVAATFNMNIVNPTEWSSNNKTGWQFIASPVKESSIFDFTDVTGDYDLYRYDGTKNLEWINHKDESNVDEEEPTITIETITAVEDNTKNAFIPSNINYDYTISQQIYTVDDLQGKNGKILSYSFQNAKNLTNGDNTRKFKIYMKNTTKTSFSDNSDWVSMQESDLVFDGNVSYKTDGEWVTINFDPPFEYESGKNIILCVYDNTNSCYISTTNYYGKTTTDNRSIYKFRDDSSFNVSSVGVTGTPTPFVGNAKFVFESVGTGGGGGQDPEDPDVPTVPAAPEVTAEAISSSSIQLTWEAVDGATSYNVYSVGNIIATITETNHTVGYLSPNTEYCFSVSAVNELGESAQTEACAMTEEAELPKCIVDFILTDQYTDGWNGNYLRISYDDGTPEENLTLEFGEQTRTFVKEISKGTAISVVYQKGSEQYTFPTENSFVIKYESGEIIAEKAQGSLKGNTTIGTFTIDCTPSAPQAPVLTAEAIDATSITLSWEAVTGAESYNVYQNGNSIATALTETTYDVADLTIGEEYCFTVTAVNNIGESEHSEEACATPEEPGAAPTTFFYDFEDGRLDDFVITDTDGDGYTWNIYAYGINGNSLVSESYISGTALSPNNRIVTKEKYNITAQSKLSFNFFNTYDEPFDVEVSINGTEFTSVYNRITKANPAEAIEISLAAYAGQNVYIALRHYNCNDGYRLMIDNLTLTDGSAVSRSAESHDNTSAEIASSVSESESVSPTNSELKAQSLYTILDKEPEFGKESSVDAESSESNNATRGAFETAFQQGVGYMASYEKEKTATFKGNLNHENSYEFNFSYNADKDLANFHLLGNPFPFDMDMSKATYTNLVEGYAVVNPDDGGYKYFAVGSSQNTADGTIKVGDGFFVKATKENPSFSYNAASKATIGEKTNSLNVIATSNAGVDNMVINFAGESEGFPKLQNFNDAIATVYVQDNGTNYGIYNCNADVQEVELNFNANQMGNYTISIEPNGKFQTVTLVDLFTNIETNMLIEDYHFTAMSDVNNNRFIVKLAVSDQQSAVSDNFVYQSGEELIVEAEGTVQIIDIMGRVVYSNDVESTNNRIDVSGFRNGTYVVRVINESEIKVEKVVIY